MQRLKQLEVFTAVIEAGGFTAATRKLGISVPTASKLVKALEERLDTKLLTRTTRTVKPTDTGLALYDKARAALSAIEEVEASLGALHEELRGSMRIAAPQDLGRLIITPVIAQFAERHTQLDIELSLTDRNINVVDEGFDVVVRIARTPDSQLVAHKVADCQRVLCAAPSYLATHGEPTSPFELRRHKLIEHTGAEDEHSLRFHSLKPGDRIVLKSRVKANSSSAIRELALNGLGVALLPTFVVAEDLQNKRLRAFLHDDLDADAEIYALYPQRRHLTAKVRNFVDFLNAEFGGRTEFLDDTLGATRTSRDADSPTVKD